MYILIVSLILVAAVLLMVVILAQNPKGGGLSSQFGGSASAQVMGVNKTSKLVEKLTWGLISAVLILTLSSSLFMYDAAASGDGLLDDIQEQPNVDPTLGPDNSTINDLDAVPVDTSGLTE